MSPEDPIEILGQHEFSLRCFEPPLGLFCAMPGKSVLDHISTLAGFGTATSTRWEKHITQSADIRNSRHPISGPFARLLNMFYGFWTTSALKEYSFEQPGPERFFPGTESPYEHLVKTELAQLQKVLLQQHASHGCDGAKNVAHSARICAIFT